MNAKNLRVLVVEDDDDFRRMLKLQLQRLGIGSVMVAENAISGLSKIEAGIVDIVVCDWHMPEMSGIDLLRRVRSIAAFKDLPFILLTAEAAKDKVVEALQEGASDYIVKPPTQKTLEVKLARFFGP